MSSFSLADIGLTLETVTPGEHRASCPACGRKDKFYYNGSSGFFCCFHASCAVKGRFREFWPKRLEEGLPAPPHRLRPAGGARLALAHKEARTAAERKLPEEMKPVAEATLEGLLTLSPVNADVPAVAAVTKYLASIGVEVAVARSLGVCAAEMLLHDDGQGSSLPRRHTCIVYVSYLFGKPVNLKYRAVDAKLFSQDSPNGNCIPFNVDCINPFLSLGAAPSEATAAAPPQPPQPLIVTEGEKDCLALRQCGFSRVLSVPAGAAALPESFFAPFEEWLDDVDEVIFCGDNDAPGRRLRAEMLAYFGPRLRMAEMPPGCKDVADLLLAEGAEAVRRAIAQAHYHRTSDIISVEELKEAVLRNLHGDIDRGFSLGYGPYTDAHFHLNDSGGLIVVTGMPNSGKTSLLNDICAHLIFKCGRSVALCSFEVPDKAALTAKFVRLGVGRENLTQYSNADLTPVTDFLNGRLFHIKTEERDPTPDNIIFYADCIRRQHALHVLVVDPYLFLEMESSARETETQSIKRMLTRFQSWARQQGVWVFVVAHPRKLNMKNDNRELEEINMYSIAGSASWANLADFILSVKRVQEPLMCGSATFDLDFTCVNVLKVRDQDFCTTGLMYFRRQRCGRYDERSSRDAIEEETKNNTPGTQDHTSWLSSNTPTSPSSPSPS